MKKVVFTHHPNNPVFGGLSAALATITDTTLWLSNRKPTMDMIDEQQPDILFCRPEEVTGGLKVAMEENPELKVVMLGVGALKHDIQPSLWCVPEDFPEHVISNLAGSVKCEVYECAVAANTVQYNQGKLDESLSSDILFIAKQHQLAAQQIDILVRLFNNADWKIRVCGEGVPMHQYTGNISLRDENYLLFNTRVGLDLTGETLLEFGINRKPCVTTMPNKFTDYVKQDYVTLLQAIDKLLSEPKLAKAEGKRLHKQLVNGNTYYHRAGDIMAALQEMDLFDACINEWEDSK